MAKILWYGDACCNTGFGRVTHSVLEHLSKDHEIHVIGINYSGDPHDYPYAIYPAANVNCQDRFGLPRIPEIIDKVKPDIFICLNDIWVANQVWEQAQFMRDKYKFKFIVYFPIDSQAYMPDMLSNIPHWDMAITFTVGSAHRILAHNIGASRLGVLPHGVDTGRFYPMEKSEARKALGLPEDKFIVLNANRNQPRKRIDLTIQAFAKFAVDKPDTMLYLHMGAKDLGWDVIPLFKKEMQKQGLEDYKRLVLTSHTINYIQAPSDEVLNRIYNACDVGINTADGEGWGLVSFEHASCRKPQIVPNHTVCADIWEEAGMLANISTWVTDKDLGVERGLVDVDHLVALLDELYYNKETYQEVADCCFAVTQRNEYRWEHIALGFSKAVEDLLA
jgi:glycosyltransferase involved in cell wall biosynthesis